MVSKNSGDIQSNCQLVHPGLYIGSCKVISDFEKIKDAKITKTISILGEDQQELFEANVLPQEHRYWVKILDLV